MTDDLGRLSENGRTCEIRVRFRVRRRMRVRVRAKINVEDRLTVSGSTWNPLRGPRIRHSDGRDCAAGTNDVGGMREYGLFAVSAKHLLRDVISDG